MKTVYGWSGGGNGTNSSGFSGLPGGNRLNNGNFSMAGQNGRWWTSTGPQRFSRYLSTFTDNLERTSWSAAVSGLSVRCLQDSE